MDENSLVVTIFKQKRKYAKAKCCADILESVAH